MAKGGESMRVDLDMFDIYEVRLTYTRVVGSTNTYPIIYVSAKENF